MDDVVGVKFEDAEQGEAAVLTWGRIFDPVDPTELLNRIRPLLTAFGCRNVRRMELCHDLGELRDYEYFYEALINFSVEAAKEKDLRRLRKRLRNDQDALRRSLYFLPRRRAEH